MRVIFAFVMGIIVGVAALWYYSTQRGNSKLGTASHQIETTAKSARDTIQEKLRSLHLDTNDIKEELARTGRVMRQKAGEAGHAIADATADARVTTAIKGKLIANRDLSALSISVSTTDGIVTLSGTVSSAEDISKAMVLALETDGVKQVISTLQVKNRASASQLQNGEGQRK